MLFPASPDEPGDFELVKYLNRWSYFVGEVRSTHRQTWNAAGEAIAKANEAMHFVHDHAGASPAANLGVALGLWGSVRRYQISALLELCARNLDEGLGILRMATELVRTAKAVTGSPEMYKAWLAGATPHVKFDVNDPAENQVYEAYKFCSTFGTHGHKTSAAYLEVTPMGREPSLAGVAVAIGRWFTSFGPMHRVCLAACGVRDEDVRFTADTMLLVAEAKLLERMQNDPFFAQPSSRP